MTTHYQAMVEVVQQEERNEMPYIKEKRREEMEAAGLSQLPVFFGGPGELNFAITRIVINYLNTTGLSYTAIAEVTGVLENVKQELYRRVATPYEDRKIAENGDVYPSRYTQTEQERMWNASVWEGWEPGARLGAKATLGYSQNPEDK